jgi:hypothetical protein
MLDRLTAQTAVKVRPRLAREIERSAHNDSLSGSRPSVHVAHALGPRADWRACVLCTDAPHTVPSLNHFAQQCASPSPTPHRTQCLLPSALLRLLPSVLHRPRPSAGFKPSTRLSRSAFTHSAPVRPAAVEAPSVLASASRHLLLRPSHTRQGCSKIGSARALIALR